MNIVLFEPEALLGPLSRSDPRAQHIINVLRRKIGDTFDAGIVNGPRGKARLEGLSDKELDLSFSWDAEPPPLAPLDLVVGLARPQTARKILQEATTLGVRSIHFVKTDRSESSYASSTLWSSGEWRRHLIEGAAQAFCTRLPSIRHDQTLDDFLNGISSFSAKVALDNYEAPSALAALLHPYLNADPFDTAKFHLCLAIGSERGWSPRERVLLKDNGFTLAHLGQRVLRTETAVVASLSIAKSTLGWL